MNQSKTQEWQHLSRKVFAMIHAANITDRAQRLLLFEEILTRRPVVTTNELNEDDLKHIASRLEGWQMHGELESRARDIVSTRQRTDEAERAAQEEVWDNW